MMQCNKLDEVRASMCRWIAQYPHAATDVGLIAVSKTRSAQEIRDLYVAGQTQFGENYLQEALEKIQNLSDCSIEWHFIGAIQSRKAAQIAENFSWVHSLDRLKVANKLNQFASRESPLNVLIQVNLEAESSKGGVAPDQLQALATEIHALENLRLRGLMFMPKVHTLIAEQRAVFSRAKSVFDELNQQFSYIDQISMGMSADMQAAIAEGTTMVRVGTALFGPRGPKQTTNQVK
jgi:pyridoxal phosphate enzyme (YggS family)